MEAGLYALATQHADKERGQSFAAYVTELIAMDLIDHPQGDGVITIERMRANRRRMMQPEGHKDGPPLQTNAEFTQEQKKKTRTAHQMRKTLKGGLSSGPGAASAA